MSILHMDSGLVGEVSRGLAQTSVSLQSTSHTLTNAEYRLADAWQGYSRDQFLGEYQPLIRRLAQLADDGQALSQRLQREVEEWEQVASQLGAGTLVGMGGLLQTSGGGVNHWLPDNFPGWPTMLPPLAIVSQLGGWLDTWPDWLKNQLSPFLPFLQPPALPAPEPVGEPTGPTRLGELLNDSVVQEPPPEPTKEVGVESGGSTAVPAPVTPPTQPAPIFNGYPVPIKSQGNLGGNAACAPTSVSMILDYYHNQNVQNQTASLQELLAMLDKGDFTLGQGMSLNRITDELQDLGYSNVSAQVNASQADLQNHLQQGPVIATVMLDMKTSQLTAAGSAVHAVVVKGISGDGQTVFINDPWTGSEVLLPVADFAATWQRGSNGLYVIRP